MQYLAEQSINRDQQFAKFIEETRTQRPSAAGLAGKAFSTMSKLAKSDGLERHIRAFERLALIHEVPEKYWVAYLVPLLDDVSAQRCDALPDEVLQDFTQTKSTLLKLNGHHRTYHRLRWDCATLDDSDIKSYLQFSQYIRQTLTDWLKLEEDPREWAMREHFLQKISPEVRAFVATHDPLTLDRAAEIADLYRANHPNARFLQRDVVQGKQKQQSNNVHLSTNPNYPKKKTFNQFQEKSSGPHAPANSKDSSSPKDSTIKCYTCGDPNHVSPNCPHKVCLVSGQSNTTASAPQLHTFRGTIFGHNVSQIVVDSGCTQSQVVAPLDAKPLTPLRLRTSPRCSFHAATTSGPGRHPSARKKHPTRGRRQRYSSIRCHHRSRRV